MVKIIHAKITAKLSYFSRIELANGNRVNKLVTGKVMQILIVVKYTA